MAVSNVHLVAFDLDGTLLRGDSAREVIARRLGCYERVRSFDGLRSPEELVPVRVEMMEHYRRAGIQAVRQALFDLELTLAPGAQRGFALLRSQGIRTAIVSLTWSFAVAAVAERLGADAHVGTEWLPGGEIVHMWPAGKAAWVAAWASCRGVPLSQVAAVGDSWGDVPMLAAVGHPVYVGDRLPAELSHARHLPGGAIDAVVEELLGLSYSDAGQSSTSRCALTMPARM